MKLKGLRRETIQTFKMLKKLALEKLTPVRKLTQKHLGLHGGFGSAPLREYVERALQQGAAAPATLPNGEGSKKSTNLPQVRWPA